MTRLIIILIRYLFLGSCSLLLLHYSTSLFKLNPRMGVVNFRMNLISTYLIQPHRTKHKLKQSFVLNDAHTGYASVFDTAFSAIVVFCCVRQPLSGCDVPSPFLLCRQGVGALNTIHSMYVCILRAS